MSLIMKDKDYNEIICSRFNVFVDSERPHLQFFLFQGKVYSINIYLEAYLCTDPLSKSILLRRLANENFFISPLPDGLERFFYALVFPSYAITLMGRIDIQPLPKKIKIIHITCEDSNFLEEHEK